jgi:precorrin-6B methylase 2
VNRFKLKPVATAGDRSLTPPYARFLGRLIRPFPNFDLFFVKRLRQRAVDRLQLHPGDRALDAGCGPGGSFPYLVDAVTHAGEVVGIEISEVMANNANARIEKNGWKNVRVVVADASAVKLQGSFDALLMMGAPDVYASPEALANLGPYMNSGARFVAFGAKLSRHRLSNVLNPVFRWMFARATCASTPQLSCEPWKSIQARAARFEVEELFFGWMFMAWGSMGSSNAS